MSLRTISSVSEVLALFKKVGHSEYGGEEVTQLQHALQTAQLAEKVPAPSAIAICGEKSPIHRAKKLERSILIRYM